MTNKQAFKKSTAFTYVVGSFCHSLLMKNTAADFFRKSPRCLVSLISSIVKQRTQGGKNTNETLLKVSLRIGVLERI